MGGFFAIQSPASINSDLPVCIGIVRAITAKTPRLRIFADRIDCRYSVAGHQSNNLIAVVCKHGMAADQDGTDVVTDKSLEGFLKFTGLDNHLDTQLHAESGRSSLELRDCSLIEVVGRTEQRGD